MRRMILVTHNRGLDVLHLARKLRAVRIVVKHVSGAAAAGREDVLLDGWCHQVLRGCLGFAGVDISWGASESRFLLTR